MLGTTISGADDKKSAMSFVDVSREKKPKHPRAQGNTPGVDALDPNSSTLECQVTRVCG